MIFFPWTSINVVNGLSIRGMTMLATLGWLNASQMNMQIAVLTPIDSIATAKESRISVGSLCRIVR